MAENFAFESGEVSVAFTLDSGLGDAIIARKVFDALIELAPNCIVDIFYVGENRKNFAQAFYGGSKNLNLILPRNEHYGKIAPRYDVGLNVVGYNFIQIFNANAAKLNTAAPKLLASLAKIVDYNNRHLKRYSSCIMCVPLVHMISARIVNKNCYTFLSCDGALPIHDDKVKLAFATEYKLSFERLKLGNYITIYTDIAEKDKFTPKVKTWPVKYFVEYVARMKKYLPQIEIVQCGGGDDVKVENADRHFMGCDLELTKYILANSLLHVGCEGGLIHLATQLGTKCLTLFGPTDVHYYGYDRNINVVSEVCSPCVFIRGDGDLRTCMRGNKEPPCMLSITPRQVFEVTRNYLTHLDLKNNA